MSKVLYIMYGMPSCYNSGFVFARQFSSSGIDIKIACDQDVSQLAKTAKIPFAHLQSISPETNVTRWLELKSEAYKTAGNRVGQLIRLVEARLALRRETVTNTEIVQLIKDYNPDLLLIDIECHVAIIASAGMNVPTALCTRLFDHRPGRGIPPLHSNINPSRRPGTSARIAAQWHWLRIRAWFKSLKQHVSADRLAPIHYRTTKMPDVKALAKQHRVDLKSVATTAHWFQPVTYTHLPILSMTLKELDFDRMEQGNFTYVGPMIDDRDYAFSFAATELDVIDRFITSARLSNSTLVYCAMGTFAKREPRFTDALRGLAESRRDLALIISLGGRENSDDYSAFPSNCLILDTAPQLKCLEAADVAILHSGIASLQEAVKHRVPLLIFAVDSMDQNGCAVRWSYRNLARRFYLDSVTTSSLAADLDGILSDEQLADRLSEYSNLMEHTSKAFSARELLEKLVSTTVPIRE